jgi:nucleoside 2-deoxyribosyltransferase
MPKLTRSVYVAGPDLFYADSSERYQNIIDTFERLTSGTNVTIELLIPGDDKFSQDDYPDRYKMATAIKKRNQNLIRRSDYVLANLSNYPFSDPDQGTIYELGYAEAFNRIVVAYRDQPLTYYKDYVKSQVEIGNILSDNSSSFNVEDFGLPLNLMLMSEIHSSVNTAIKSIINKIKS